MAVQEVLTGIQIHRNGRYPYDYEQVHNSYSDVLEKLESDGNQGTKKGTFYAGMFTAVVDDENPSYNGPYYISYQKTGEPGNIKITYKSPFQKEGLLLSTLGLISFISLLIIERRK